MNINDTIIAPATPPGEGGVAILRISGPKALSSLLQHFQPTQKINILLSHRLYHGRISDQNSELIDEVMAVYMQAPRSYTCEDVVEVHCHGSRQVIKRLLTLFQLSGIRLAKPGEFTYRAFVNGRIDLPQAEAVSSLITAHSEAARKMALAQISGALSQRIHSFSHKIKKSLVFLEAWIDFPEEDLPQEDLNFIAQSMGSILHSVQLLSETYSYGRIQKEGASILLVGPPNVGKSSLLNYLLGEDRAIVTAVPGTTRDILEEGVEISGLPVRLIDTAGLRETDDIVEIEGIKRVAEKMAGADLILFLVDGSQPFSENEQQVFHKCKDYPAFLVLTKQDLPQAEIDLSFNDLPVCRISTKTGDGMENLKSKISGFLSSDRSASAESVVLAERRHYEALLMAQQSLLRFTDLLHKQESLEFLSFELREALRHLGQITGEVTTESLLDDIFSGFCIGK